MAAPMSSLLLVGCGKMGRSLLERWKRSPFIPHFHVIEPNHAEQNESLVTWHKSLASLPENYAPNVVVFAVKPQELESILPEYRERFADVQPIYLSIAAGKTLPFYTRHLGEHAHVVRAMPNTPAMVGQGMTVLCAVATLPASEKKIATELMSTVGKTEWLNDESLMDAVTAISGCGPAYAFLFLESLVNAGVRMGLPEGMAKNLAVQTVAGSIALSAHSGKSFEQLRIQVASPGGATEAALRILMGENGLSHIIESAAKAAEARSSELNNS